MADRPVGAGGCSFAEKTHDIVHWRDVTSGGHLAAHQQPELTLAAMPAFIAAAPGERP